MLGGGPPSNLPRFFFGMYRIIARKLGSVAYSGVAFRPSPLPKTRVFLVCRNSCFCSLLCYNSFATHRGRSSLQRALGTRQLVFDVFLLPLERREIEIAADKAGQKDEQRHDDAADDSEEEYERQGACDLPVQKCHRNNADILQYEDHRDYAEKNAEDKRKYHTESGC